MKTIYVYLDWIEEPIAKLQIAQQRRKESVFVEMTECGIDFLNSIASSIDPDIQAVQGPQFTTKTLFGMLEDSSPDRWGRSLMKRRHERECGTTGNAIRTLLASDFLIGVHDPFRQGALRFKLDQEGPFIDDHEISEVPTEVNLRELLSAAQRFENDEIDISDDEYDWLQCLIAPGSSLGGARPKASILDNRQLMIAKFPSTKDEWNTGLWEFIVNQLAKDCGLNVPPCKVIKVGSAHHTFITERFDRKPDGSRVHFCSAMTMLGKTDGDGASTGVSYLDLARAVSSESIDPLADLHELWKRMVFHLLVSNTDDHLRNHGFLFDRNAGGWRLSPAFDINLNPMGSGLALNITENDNDLDLELAVKVAKFFRIKNETEARKIVTAMAKKVSAWKDLANKLKVSQSEIKKLAPAFELAEEIQ